MGKCTIPRILGFGKWFDECFLDLCEAHDIAYLTRIWAVKVQSDYILTAGIIGRGYFCLGVLCFAYCMIFGTLLWGWKKWKHLLIYKE